MTTTAERIRAHRGPAILSYGFRPLFLSAGVWSAVAMALWIGMLTGTIGLVTAFEPLDWHVHELLFGYLPAVVAGFLLTAIPNWTGRLPVAGRPLLLIVLIWWAGRTATLLGAALEPALVAAIDLAFLATLAFLAGREIVAGRNWRNLKVLVAIGLLFLGDAVFHVEALGAAAFLGYGTRIGTAAAIFLIMLIGGRIVPSFTRNWLARRGAGRLPVAFNRFDAATLAIAGLALAAWVLAPQALLSALLCFLAGALHLWRQARWAPERTLGEPLLWILHAAYLFVPLGFLLVGVAMLVPSRLTMAAATHAWTAGAVGTMTLAVMTRASLGHTGRPLKATPGVTLLYGCVLVATFLRIIVDRFPDPILGYAIAAALWVAAFVIFTIVFAPILSLPRARST